MDFERLLLSDEEGIEAMSSLATGIVREHFDPIIGRAQNDYMIKRSQSPEAIRAQLAEGCEYYFVSLEGQRIGYLAFYPKGEALYLSKFYLRKDARGRGFARPMMDFVLGKAREAACASVELNVNRNNDARFVYDKLGFTVIREEKIDIGGGFFMDDYVYSLKLD